MAGDTHDQIPVSAPIDTDAAGRGGPAALQSVVRVICPDQNSAGTGFIHKSGKIITAAHVIANCKQAVILGSNNSQLFGKIEAIDDDLDLALLSTVFPSAPGSLELFDLPDVQIGTQVTTWGYPGGYSGLAPLLSVGYLAGIQAFKSSPSSAIVRRWVVNAAFNSGNSGGPLIHLETGKVIGVVSSKLAPISKQTEQILSLLSKQRSGFTYSATSADGTQSQVTEGQLIGMVLNDLRGQVQLVVGYAVTMDDLKGFLKKHGVAP